jgi:membrane fusion protein (multidrug efflux system)
MLKARLALVALFMIAHAAWSASDAVEEFDGLLAPSASAELGSPVPGVLDQVLVDRGDAVKSGQIVAKLNCDVENASIELARARVEFGRRKVGRNEPLAKKELVSGSELDEQRTEVRLAEAQLREALARRDVRVIRTPISGVVTHRTRSAGEYIGETPVVTVACIDPLKVEVTVPMRRLGSIRPGMKAQVRPEIPANVTYEADVTIVDPIVDAASGTFGVRLRVANPARSLAAGVKCKVRFAER